MHPFVSLAAWYMQDVSPHFWTIVGASVACWCALSVFQVLCVYANGLGGLTWRVVRLCVIVLALWKMGELAAQKNEEMQLVTHAHLHHGVSLVQRALRVRPPSSSSSSSYSPPPPAPSRPWFRNWFGSDEEDEAMGAREK